jgi:NAD(P)H-dependent FMN reductase
MSGRRANRIAVILGTTRPGNYTGKALRLVADTIEATPGCACDFIDPALLKLPSPGGPASLDADRLQRIVRDADGVALSTPEYHGGPSSTIKLVIENLGFPSILAGKPIALLGVAAGRIGAIKSLEGLRSVCSHVGAIVLPGPVSIAGVRGIFDEDGKCLDEAVETQIHGLVTGLVRYINEHVCPRQSLEETIRAGLA